MDIEKQVKRIGSRIQTLIFSVRGEPESPSIKVNGNSSFDFGVNRSALSGRRENSDFRLSHARDKVFKVNQCDQKLVVNDPEIRL